MGRNFPSDLLMVWRGIQEVFRVFRLKTSGFRLPAEAALSLSAHGDFSLFGNRAV
jgi:hypothetical protein